MHFFQIVLVFCLLGYLLVTVASQHKFKLTGDLKNYFFFSRTYYTYCIFSIFVTILNCYYVIRDAAVG